MKKLIIKVQFKTLSYLLGLPPNITAYGIIDDPDEKHFLIKIKGKGLPKKCEIPEGGKIPEGQIWFKEMENGTAKIKKIEIFE